MNKESFTEEDKKKVIEFLNYIATHAKFELDTQQLIKYYHSLSFMQQVLLPKIEANILEVIAVKEAEENKKTKKSKK